MKLSPELNAALNEQYAHEIRNMLVYKKIESYFEGIQLKNIAKYFSEQAQHEKEHGDKFLKHINDRAGGSPELLNIEIPNISIISYKTTGVIFLEVEESTTASIEEIYDLAIDQKSYVDLPFLLEMLAEQVEEEDSAQHFLARINSTADIVLLDATF